MSKSRSRYKSGIGVYFITMYFPGGIDLSTACLIIPTRVRAILSLVGAAPSTYTRSLTQILGRVTTLKVLLSSGNW